MVDLSKEILKRLKAEDNTYQIIGSEIKLTRLKLSKTLENVVENCCSTSYLCKIERNSINPNPYFLNKICENLNLTEEHLSLLYELKSLLVDMVKAYYYEDSDKIEYIYSKIVGFDNYRAKIMKVIYMIYTKNYLGLDSKIKELLNLHKNMSDFDVIIFSLFYSMYCIIENKLDLASDTLNSILQYKYQDEYLYALVYENLSYIHYCANTSRFIYYNELEIQFHYRFFMIKKAKRSSFIKALYYLKHDNIAKCKRLRDYFLDSKYKNTLDLLIMIHTDQQSELDIFNSDSFIDDFYRLLWLEKVNKVEFQKEINSIDSNESIYGSKLIYLRFLEAKTLDEHQFMSILNQVLFPYALNSMDGFLIKMFSNILLEWQIKLSHYKKYADIAQKIQKIQTKMDNL